MRCSNLQINQISCYYSYTVAIQILFPALSSNMTYTIRLRNEDDNDPRTAIYEFMIQENNQINDFIGQVKATDLDPPKIGYDFTETETLFMIKICFAHTIVSISSLLVRNLAKV